MTSSWRRLVAAVVIVSGCSTSSRGPTPEPTTTWLATTVVPALQVHNPSVAAQPSTGLHDGQTVTVRVSGFGPGGKVHLSECASRLDAGLLGCGEQVAAQPFLLTGADQAGTTRFKVTIVASSKPYNMTAISRCSSSCVLVASSGGGFAITSLQFVPT